MVAIYIYALVPEFLMRFLAWILIHACTACGRPRHIPEKDPAYWSATT